MYRHPKPEALQNAKQLAINLIQTMQSELQSYIQQQPPPVQSQQVIEQSQMPQSMNQLHFINIKCDYRFSFVITFIFYSTISNHEHWYFGTA